MRGSKGVKYAELDALRKITTPQPVPCCHYPAQMMALAVFMGAQTKLSLRLPMNAPFGG